MDEGGTGTIVGADLRVRPLGHNDNTDINLHLQRKKSLILWKRRSPRLPDYDYSLENAYFVTTCVQARKSFFGRIIDGSMVLNHAGSMIAKWWQELERKFLSIKIDEYYVVMPNHFHGIVHIAGSATPANEGGHAGPPLQKVIQWFKTMTTNEYIHRVKEDGWPPFKGSLWQRSYYDDVIRDEKSLNRIREYIADNPQRWELDRENPRAKGKDEFDHWLDAFKAKPSIFNRRGGPACPPLSTRGLGDAGEDLAAATLKKRGYKILERNYTCPLGEIDLIARQGQEIVFVEVKTRRSEQFGAPEDGVHPAKQAKLRKLADYYLKQKRLGEDVPVRFDVVAITINEDGPRVEIIPDAF